MKTYIEREALKRELAPYEENDFSQQMDVILAIVDAQPAADVAEVKHGRWKNGGNGLYDTCSACGKEIYLAIPMNYCPECGALMDGKEDEDGQDPIKRSASDH